MPTYDFQCDECGKVHEIFRRFSDQLPQTMDDMDQPCCRGEVKVTQLLSIPHVSVKGEASTLGQLAQQNSDNMGRSQVSELSEQYRTKKEDAIKLKEGMSVDKRGKADQQVVDRINKINNMSDSQKQRFIEKGE